MCENLDFHAEKR